MINDFQDVSLDSEINKVNNLKYLPWIGKNYNSLPKNKKTLIIAESIYGSSEGDEESLIDYHHKEFSREVVYYHGLYSNIADAGGMAHSPTFRNLERSIFGEKNVDKDSLLRLWTSVSLHQYVQRLMNDISERPSYDDYLEGAKILKKVLNIIEPSLIVFLGTDNSKFSALTEVFSETTIEEYSKINGAIPKKIMIKNNSNTVPVVMIKHPGRYYSWDKWHQFLSEYLPAQHIK